MFLYAYTLEENDGKSFYSIINNTLCSGDSEKICRYLPEFKMIYDLIRSNYLKVIVEIYIEQLILKKN